MLKNGLNQDFLQNGSKDFINFVNLNETNVCLSIVSGYVFWANLDLGYGSIMDFSRAKGNLH